MAEKSATTTHETVAASTPKESASASPSAPSPHALRMLQRTAGNRAVTAALADRGGGQPLPDAMRLTFEPLFARSFANVRVHSGPRAAQLADGIGARAFTRGSDIYLGDGGQRPATIAHELAHVVQQDGSRAAQARVSAPDDVHEREADRAAHDVLAGRTAQVAAASAPPMLQRAPGDSAKDAVTNPPATTNQPMLAGFQPTIASQYPSLVLLLPEADIAGLEAASEVRYKRATKTEQKAAAAEAKTSAQVPLALLLTSEAHFIDLDVWGSFFYMVKAGAADVLTADLARNEIMRRYFARVELSRFDTCRIELVDPEGKTPGPSRLRFVVKEKTVPDTKGKIAPPDLAVAFGPIEPDVESVTKDADHVALGAQLILELEDVEGLVTKTAAGVSVDAGNYALNYVRSLAQRLQFDLKHVETYGKHKGPELQELAGVEGRYKKLLEVAEATHAKAYKFWEANQVGESLGMMNERWGTSLVRTAENEMDEGGVGYVTGGLAYGGAFVVAFVDAAEKILSMGFHDAATAIGTAYAEGNISYNEALDLAYSAAWRALLTAAITRGAGAGASRIGAAAATGLNITAQTTKFGLVAGGVAGTITTATSLAAQSVLTKAKSSSFSSPSGQAIWNQGMPTGMGWAIGLGLGAGLGSLGGAWSVQVANAQRIGQIIQTPTGPMRVVTVMPNGSEVLEPLTKGVKIPAGYSGATVTVPKGWSPSSMLLPGGQNAMVPAGQNAMVPFGPQTFGTAATGAPQMGYAPLGLLPQVGQPFGMLPAGPQPFGMLPAGPQPFGMLPAGPQPFGMLPAGPQPFGMLPAGPQPFGMLPAGPQPFGYLPAPPQPFGLLPPAPEPTPLAGLLLMPEARLIPGGASGTATGGSSQALGKNMMVNFGMPRSTSFSGWQPHHIIPGNFVTHPVIRKIGMDLDHPANGIMLPEPATNWPGNLPTHQGFHRPYNVAIKAELDAMDVNLPVDVLALKVYRLQLRLRAAIEAGTPLYPSKGATPTTWPNVINPPIQD